MSRRLRFGRLSLYIEPRDAWIGAYVAPDAIYVCPFPLLVIKWERRPSDGRLRRVLRGIQESRQARRDYRALCGQGRAAVLDVSIRIHSEDYEWTGLDGITGLATTVPLTRAGKRYVRGILRDIETTCVRAVLIANRKAREEAQ